MKKIVWPSRPAPIAVAITFAAAGCAAKPPLITPAPRPAIVAPAIAAARPSLISNQIFQSGSSIELTSKTEGVSGTRGSLDANLVVAIIQERAKQITIRAVADAMKGTLKGAEGVALRELVTQAIALLSETGGPRREQVEEMAKTLVRTILAPRIVAMAYPDDPALISDARWKRNATWDLTVGELPEIRRYLIEWTFLALAELPAFAQARSAAPECPFQTANGKAFCDGINVLSPDDRLAWAAAAVGLSDVAALLGATARIGGGDDFPRLVRAITQSGSIANFDGTEGLDLAAWKDSQKRWEDKFVAFVVTFSACNASIQTLLSSYAANSKDPAKTALIAASAKATFDAMSSAEPVLKPIAGDELWDAFNSWVNVLQSATAAPLPPLPALLGPNAERLIGSVSRLGIRVGTFRMATQGFSDLLGAQDAVESVFVGANLGVGKREVGDLKFGALAKLIKALDSAAQGFNQIVPAVELLGKNAEIDDIKVMQRAITRLRVVLEVLRQLNGPGLAASTTWDTMKKLQILGASGMQLLRDLGPVLDAVGNGKRIDIAVVAEVVGHVDIGAVIAALRFQDVSSSDEDPCQVSGSSALCWSMRVVRALQGATVRDGAKITLDGPKLAEAVVAFGDDFKRQNEWHPFFHLTVGLGQIYSVHPPGEVAAASVGGQTFQSIRPAASRSSPIISEQIGVGMASPSLYNDRLAFKVGVFGSGLLYRVVLDTKESDAVLFGAFAALDVYQLLELYVAPAAMVYPPSGGLSYPAQFGFSVGAQVPLGDYLNKL
jgi:hypothetical protein